jgi:hypothetical protein
VIRRKSLTTRRNGRSTAITRQHWSLGVDRTRSHGPALSVSAACNAVLTIFGHIFASEVVVRRHRAVCDLAAIMACCRPPYAMSNQGFYCLHLWSAPNSFFFIFDCIQISLMHVTVFLKKNWTTEGITPNNATISRSINGMTSTAYKV